MQQQCIVTEWLSQCAHIYMYRLSGRENIDCIDLWLMAHSE